MDLPEEAVAYADADFSESMHDLVDRLLELAGDRRDARLVDLGTGPASIPILIAKHRPRWQITGVDASEAMLAIARDSIGSPNIFLRLADVKSTGLPAHSFDIVLCSSVLHHMPDPLLLWTEIKRLAAPGALIMVRDLHRPASELEAEEIVHMHASGESKLLQHEFYRSLLAAFTMEEIEAQVRDAAMDFLRVEHVGDRHIDVYGLSR